MKAAITSCVMCCVTVLAVFLLSFSPQRLAAYFNSDVLYGPALLRDLEDQVPLDQIRLPPAPYFVPDLLVFAALRGAKLSIAHEIYLFSALQGVVLFALLYTLLYRLTGPLNWRSASITFFVLAIPFVYNSSTLAIADQFHFNTLLLPTYHGGTFILIVALLILSLRELRLPGTAIFALGTFAVVASDRIAIVWWTMPFVLSCFLSRRRKQAAVNGVASVFGVLAHRAASRFTEFGGLPHRTEPYLHAVISAARDMAFDISRDPIILAAFACTVTAAWLSFVMLRSQNESASDRSRALFFFAALTLSFIAPILSATYQQRADRYLYPALVLGPVVLLWHCFRTPAPAQPSLRHSITQLLCPALFLLTLIWNCKFDPKFFLFDYYSKQQRCVDQHLRGQIPAIGAALYWFAAPLERFSRTGIRMVQITPQGKFHHHIGRSHEGTTGLFGDPAAIKSAFVVTNGIKVKGVLRSFGKPQKTFQCEGLTVWLYSPTRVSEPRQRRMPAEKRSGV